jgi:rod shape-determining protein MreC
MRLLVISLVAFTLMFVDYRYAQFQPLRRTLALIVFPIQKIVDFPFSAAQNFGGFLATHNTLLAENKRLKDEQLLQLAKLQKLAALEKENEHLHELLRSGTQVSENMLVASIINIDPDPFTHQVIINKGKEDGVFQGQTIIDAHGVLGTIIAVNDFESRAMLVTDASHAVPVEDVRNGVRAIAVGTGSRTLELRHVPKSLDIEVGDMLITSGLGGRFPTGFPVGKVTDVKRDRGKPFATIVLQPAANLDRGGHILLIKQTTTPRGNDAKREKH